MATLSEFVKFNRELDAQFYQARETFLSNTIIAAAGLFGAVIALSDNSRSTEVVRILFVLSTSIGLFGILLAIIGLKFQYVLAAKTREKLRSLANNRAYENEQFLLVDPPKIYWRIGVVGLILLVLSLLLLLGYIIVKNLPELFC